MKSSSPSTPAPKRAYDSSGRRQQARATRARIRDAARDRFLAHGYAGTSIGAVAETAGVAPQTIYGAFGSKAMLLKEVIEVALAGDDEPVPVFDRAPSQQVLEATSAAEAVALLAANVRQIFERVAALLAMADVAAADEPVIAAMAKGGAEGRLQDLGRLVEALADRGLLRPGVEVADAIDHVWALSTPAVYLSATRDRGWTPDEYEAWLRRALGLVIG